MTSAFTWLRRWFPTASSSPRNGSRLLQCRRRIPLLEQLEDRTLLNGGALDPTFGQGGKVLTNSNGTGIEANAISVQSNGEILVAGTFPTQPGSSPDLVLARYTKAGSLDTSFGSGGLAFTGSFGFRPTTVQAVAEQSDGKIILVSAVDELDPQTHNFNLLIIVEQFTSAGALDTSFGSGGSLFTTLPAFTGLDGDLATALAVQSNGMIVVAGFPFTFEPDSSSEITLARYTAKGKLDSTFGSGGLVANALQSDDLEAPMAVALQSDGQIVVANHDEIARFTPAGALENGFYLDNKSLYDPRGLAVQNDGKIVIAGSYNPTISSLETSYAVSRYKATGTLDSSFGSGGNVLTSFKASTYSMANAVALQSDGKIVVAGFSVQGTITDFALARYIPQVATQLAVTAQPPHIALRDCL